jgi:predicted Zn finger-like uncharacterized protein
MIHIVLFGLLTADAMIQTCPSCAARFALADDAFAKGARKLRCAKCHHVWKADSQGVVVEEAVLAAVTAAPIVSEHSAPRDTPVAPDHGGTVSEKRVAPLVFTKPPLPPTSLISAPLMHNVERIVVKLPRLPRRLAWCMCIVLLLVMVLALWVGKYKVVARFPSLEHFYIEAGLINPQVVDSFDLQLKQAEKCLISGRNMLCLTGTVTNKTALALAVPVIYISALDKDGQEFKDKEGKAMLTWKIIPESDKLLPKEVRNFSLTEPYPDKTITDFDYGFIDDEH